MKSYFKDYLKLLGFVKSFRKLLILAGICMGVSTIFEGISLGMIVPLSDRVLTDKKIIIPGNIPGFLASIIDKLNSLDSAILLKYIVFLIPAVFLFKGLFMYLQSCLMNVVGQGVVREVRNKLYSKFQDLSLDFYASKRTGELMSRVTNDVKFINNSLSYGLTDLMYETMRATFLGAVAFFLAFKISWKLALFAFVIFPAIMIPVSRLGKRIKKFSLETQVKMADLNSLMAETIQGAYIVKSFCREDYELDRFKKINQNYYKFMLKAIKRIIVLSPLTEFIGVVGAAVIMWIVGNQVIEGNISFGVFGLFLATLLSIMRPIKKLSNVHAINQQALAASDRIYDILEEEPQIKDLPGAQDIKEFNDKIVFSNVCFAYDLNEGNVLENIDLVVNKGEIIALVGHSGAGKSTLVGLLARLYDSQKGKISIDGRDISKLKLKPLRSLISIVSQDMVLFNATVRENIAYGKDGASESQIIEAAKQAHAYEFIQALPAKFDTIIGDRGFRLSGGQKQRISIARAMLKDAPILILDEATSHLDSAAEQLVKEAFYTLMRNKTVFVIAHRLSTVQKADRIVVLEKGRIVEQGVHSGLIAENTLYRKLYELQFNV